MAIDEDGSDFSYFSVMRFGSKQQEMYMLVDTGSANTWVFGSDCQSSACSERSTFGNADSDTLNVTSTAWSLIYGTGQVGGELAHDTVAFANFSIDLSFGLASNASDDFNKYPMDGTLGLGIPSSTAFNVPTVMDVLNQLKLLRENLVGIHLQRESDNLRDGQITFGSVDQSKYNGALSYITCKTENKMWEIPLEDASINGQPCNFDGKSAVIDTGTSYILMPFNDAQAIHQLIPGATNNGESFVIPCDTDVIVQFRFLGVSYDVGPSDYLGRASGSMCSSNIVGHQPFGPDQWILGDIFLKNVYTVFDFDKARIGEIAELEMTPADKDRIWRSIGE